MWRNFRIRTKMMLGFALILLVFAISVAVTWSLMSEVSDGNDFIVTRALPAQAMATELDEGVYELLLTMRALQYSETDAVIADVKARRAELQKMMDAMAALYASTPDARSAAYVVENVLPRLKSYFETIDASLADITNKAGAFNAIMGYANTMSQAAENLRTALLEHSKRRTQAGDSNVNAQVRRLSVLDQAAKIALMVGDVRLSLLRAVTSNSLADMNANFTALDAIEAAAASLRNETTVPENQRMADDLTASVGGYRKGLQDYMAEFKTLEELTNKRTTLRDEINNGTTEAINIAQRRIQELSTGALADLNTSIMLLVASAVVSILLGILIAFFISRSIAKPLSTIVGLTKRAGGGDLTIEAEDFHYNGKDELGELVNAVSSMIISQADALQEVVAVSNDLGGSAGGLSAISEETNASMEEVKASIDQVSSLSENNGAALQQCNAGVEEMSAGADTVAQSATDSAAFISQTTEASNRAIQTVNKVIKGMNEVDANSQKSEDKIKRLVDSVENVSSFVSVITGIADQTNLLALNAAIEAARAGEVGRGFAVVAEEVRKLAEESARAAQNVNSIIVELQSGARESIDATTEAGRKLGDTLVQAELAQKELDEALKEINKANDAIQNIAAVAEEQAASSKEVATAIDSATKSTMEMVETINNIQKATEETSHAAQSVALHSETMNGHAQDLTDVLSRFKLPAGVKAEVKAQGKQIAVLKAKH